MKIKDISSKEFKSIYSRVPRLCVEVIIQTQDGILLTKRAITPCKGEWHTPGGTVIKGERLEQTVKRVAKAELGLKIRIKEILGVIEYTDIKNYFGHAISIAFLAEPISRHRIKLDYQASEFGFFKKMPPHTIKDQKRFLEKFLKRKTKQNIWI